MRTENVLWWLAIACASALLIAPATPHTSWSLLPEAPPRDLAGAASIEGFGWLHVAALAGLVVLLTLTVARRKREDTPKGAVFAAMATIAFGFVAVGLTRSAFDLSHSYGRPGREWILHPAPLPPIFAAIAAVGMACSLVLSITWLRPPIAMGNDSEQT
jgi:hypothetical protein